MGVVADYYSLLNLPQDASHEEVRDAYFQAARKYHPDANPDPFVRERFIQIQQAYEVLSNPKQRAKYDLALVESFILPDISIDIKNSRSIIPRLKEEQLFYSLIDIRCSSKYDPTKRAPFFLCMVVDTSTSMTGKRLELVKKNLINLMGELNPDDKICFVAFSDRAKVILEPVQKSDIRNIDQYVHMFTPEGGTELYQGLLRGYRIIKEFGKNYISKHLVLMTDGHTYGDEEDALALSKEAEEQGIVINAFGFGDEWNDNFLDKLTSNTGGNAVYVRQADDLQNHLIKKIQVYGKLYANKIRYDFFKDSCVELKYAFRIHPDITPLQCSDGLHFGNLQYNGNLKVFLEFAVKPILETKKNLRVSSGRLRMNIANVDTAAQMFLKINVPVSEKKFSEAPPASIVEAMSKLMLYRMQEKARDEIKNGQIAEGTKHLQHLATHLLSQGNRELARTVLLEAEHINKNKSFSSEGDKRIKYATRSLLLPSGLE
jgi:Ca-activated chloride channel family protein